MALLAQEPLDAAFEVELPSAPYPGLRPFNPDEWPIFFGREQMTDEVIARVIRQHLVVVHGDSGCGKSSLVRAGVLAQLEQERARSGVRWRTAIALPREAPLRRLAEAIAELQRAADDQDHAHQVRRVLNRGADAPAALAELLRNGDDDNVCILIDQFEELFAFASHHGREEAQLFVDILVGLQQNPPPGLYAILTMRSEFLGVCARFKGLAEAVNRTQYLLPQMDRPALIRAIREPALLYDGEVSRALAERLIADAAGDQDQLPLIQHGLMQLYWEKFGLPTAGYSGLAKRGFRILMTATCSKTPRCRSGTKRSGRNRSPRPLTRQTIRLSRPSPTIAVQPGSLISKTIAVAISPCCCRTTPTRSWLKSPPTHTARKPSSICSGR
jgi:hypothetical protein